MYEPVAPDPPAAVLPPAPGPFEAGAMRVRDAVAFAGISRSSLFRRMRAGSLPYAVVDGKRLVSWAALVRLLAENEVRR